MSVKYVVQILAVSVLAQAPFFAQADEVKSNGGIEVYRSDDNRFWFNLSGIMKVDATFFIDNHNARQNEFPSGTNVRGLETTFNGGIGEDLSYTITLGFENGVSVNDAYFTYGVFDNLEVSVGQVISPFCLESANSGKWIPFLERSLPVIALRPCMGTGVNVANWGSNHSIQVASTTPLHGSNLDSAGISHRSDKFTNTGRFVYAPYRQDNKVVQVGFSGVYADNSPTFRDGTPNTDGRRFSSRPEARARNTRSTVDSGNSMLIRHYTTWGAEVAGQWGPFLAEAEYLQTNITRDDLPRLQFYGWHAQVSYVLTGERRIHKMKGASFGRVDPKCKYGAWEVAARYSMVNLNDEDIHGGKENNTSIALGWYVNNHLKILANYIHANIDPTQARGAANNPNPAKRNLDIFGMRAQVVW